MTESTPTPTPSQRPSPVLVIFLVLPLLGIVAAILMIVQNERQRISQQDVVDLPAEIERRAAALINYTAPQFAVNDLDGKPVSLADYEGRVVFLNFWTTDCPPCQRELPAFSRFASEQGETGAAVLTVNIGESAETVQNYFTKNGIQGLRVALDLDQSVGGKYSIIARPVTYIIDGKGIIRAMKAGEMTIEDMDDYLAQIQSTAQS